MNKLAENKGEFLTLLAIAVIAISTLAVYVSIPVQAATFDKNDVYTNGPYGNGVVSDVGTNHVLIEPELDTGFNRRMWFYAQLDDIEDKEITFTIFIDAVGRMSYFAPHPVISVDGGQTWEYLENFGSNGTVRFVDMYVWGTYDFGPDDTAAIIAAYIPQYYSDHTGVDVDDDLEDLVTAVNGTEGYDHVSVEAWDGEHDGLNVYLFTVGTNYSKPSAWIFAGLHASELWSQWTVRGILDEVIDTPLLYESYVWKIVPMMNPDSVVAGKTRLYSTESPASANDDMNRDWDHVDSGAEYGDEEEQKGLYDAMTAWIDAGYSIDIIIDNHVQYQSSWGYLSNSLKEEKVIAEGDAGEWAIADSFHADLIAETYFTVIGQGTTPGQSTTGSAFLADEFSDDQYGNNNALSIPLYFLLEMPQEGRYLTGTTDATKESLAIHGQNIVNSLADELDEHIEPYAEIAEGMVAADWEDFWETEVIPYANEIVNVSLEVQTDHQKGDTWFYDTAGGHQKNVWKSLPKIGIQTSSGYENMSLALRFANLGALLPPGNVTIDSAYVLFNGKNNTGSDTVPATIAGYLDGGTLNSGFMQDRNRTTATVAWNMNDWETSYSWKTSPDISSVIQELIEQEGYDGHIALEVADWTQTSGDNSKAVKSFPDGASYSPKLQITYTYNFSKALDDAYSSGMDTEEWETFWNNTVLPMSAELFTVNATLIPEENEHDAERYHDGSTWKKTYYASTSYVGNDDAASHDEQCTFMRFTFAGAVLGDSPTIEHAYLNLYMSNGDGGTSDVAANVTVAEDGSGLTSGDPTARAEVSSGPEAWTIGDLGGYGWETSPSLVDQVDDLIDLEGWDGHFCIGVEQMATNSGTLNKNIKTWESSFDPEFKISYSIDKQTDFKTLLSDYEAAEGF